MAIKRGDVLWVDFDPAKGSEIKKIRPGIVVSNSAANAALSRLQVVPLTSNTSKLYPGECLVTIKKDYAKAMTDQIRTVSKERCGKKLSVLSDKDMSEVDTALKVQLGLR